MKKILIIGLIFLSVFLIYLANMDKKVYYVALGDSLEKFYLYDNEVYGYSYYVKKYLKDNDLLERYSDDFSKVNMRSTDLINSINSNQKVVTSKGSFNLKNALIKADLVTLNLNYDDIFSKINSSYAYNEIYDYIDGLAYDLDNLFKLMREYCKEDIMLIGFYNPFKTYSDDVLDVFEYLEKKYKNVCSEYKVIYVDISDLDGISPSNLKKIGNRVIDKINKKMFET